MNQSQLKGGAWVLRSGESDRGWAWPIISKSPWSNMFVIELFHRRLVISWYSTKQLTPEEQEREDDNFHYWETWRKEQEIKADLEEK